MGDIFSAISDDEDEYAELCKKYGEKQQTGGPYGAHAKALKKCAEAEYQQRLKVSQLTAKSSAKSEPVKEDAPSFSLSQNARVVVNIVNKLTHVFPLTLDAIVNMLVSQWPKPDMRREGEMVIRSTIERSLEELRLIGLLTGGYDNILLTRRWPYPADDQWPEDD